MDTQLEFLFDSAFGDPSLVLRHVVQANGHAQTNTLYVRESSAYIPLTDDQVLDYARRLIPLGLRRGEKVLKQPSEVRDFLRLQLSRLDYEVFGCLYLDARMRLVAIEDLFRGTIDKAEVYPREVVKSVLRHAASAVIIYHNHPSGVARPSLPDRMITSRLKEALKLIDVNLLDHLIIGDSVFSFSEYGLL